MRTAVAKTFLDRHWVKIMFAGALLLPTFGWVAVLATSGAIETGLERMRRVSFDSNRWQRHLTEAPDPIRIRMVDDLLERYDLTTLDRQGVTALLGEPDRTRSFREWDLTYRLGPARDGLWFDSEWLVVRLDDQGRVHQYDIEVETD
jgi:hypothetical protein